MQTFKNYLQTPTNEEFNTDEIEEMIDRATDFVIAILKDTTKSTEERAFSRQILDWISVVDDNFHKDGEKLDSSTINGIMRIVVAGVVPWRFEKMVSDWKRVKDSVVPTNYADSMEIE